MTNRNELPFCNKTMDRAAMKRLIGKLVVCFGIASTTNISDQVKVLGFQQATKASVSPGIDDLSAVPTRGWLVRDAEKQGYVSEQHYRCGSLHAIEKLRQSIETWYATSECSKREMNPSFKMIDPLNPVHMMSFSGARGTISQVHQLLGMRGLMSDPRGQVIDLPIRRNLREGLSLTEYIISRYGARKGVVDTAVRTSDAGYLTRRPVEVVQHIAVRKRDCETTRSIVSPNIGEQRRGFIGTMSHQKLVGRVLAGHVYWDIRCVATRNQDISDRLAANLVASLQPIHVRSPLTRKSIFRICQLRYGWSLAHYDLVELGEAVGIIAGQSIGEPGTQLTSRTFHTGGVFTGDIAEYVRIPFNGLINSDEKLVHPTRTRHGHPAWMCRNDLPLLIDSFGNIRDSVIPARSLLMIQNGQYVESQQIVAEVRSKEFPPKERIQKPISPNLRGEIHWSKFVWHVRDSICNTTRSVQEASHIWILSGSFSNFDKNYFFHKDQDRVGIKPYSIGKQRDQPERTVEAGAGVSDCVVFQKGIREFGLDPKCFSNWLKRPKSNYILSNIGVERSELEKSISLLLERHRENLDELHLITFDVQLNNVLDEDHIFVTYENFEYRTSVLGVMKFDTLEIEPINKEKSCFDVLIPEEFYFTREPPSFISMKNNTTAKEVAQINGNITAEARKLIQMGKKSADVVVKRILPGHIYNPEKRADLHMRVNTLVAPSNIILDKIEVKNWVQPQSFTYCRKTKTSVPTTPVAEYDISSEFLAQVLSCPDKPKTQRRAKAETLLFIRHKSGEKLKVINHMAIQLVRTCIVTGWRRYLHETLPAKRDYLSLISVKINNLINTFLQVNPMVSTPTRRRIGVNQVFQESMHLDKRFNPSHNRHEFAAKYRSIIHLAPEPSASLLILSPFNFSRNCSFANSNDSVYGREIGKYFHGSESERNGFTQISGNIKNRLPSSKYESLKGLTKTGEANFNFGRKEAEQVGLVGTLWPISRLSILRHFSLNGKAFSNRKGFANYLANKLGHQNLYLIDENKLLLECSTNYFPKKSLLDKPIYSLPKLFGREILLISLGLPISENRYLRKDRACLQSGQVIAIHQNYSLVRTGKTLLATRGANPHKISGDIIEEGDTLITLPYDRLKSGDITQGLPKIEQLLESRSIASIPAGIGDLFGKWCRSITKLIGNLWSHFLSAGRSMEQCQLVLIDQIRKVYESQGVQISDKHLEIIVCQLTSRVVASEDGVTNVFLPGELVELSQAERMNRVLKRSIFYEPIVLGMTKASLNTTSFSAEASFQETTRVLAKAALRGRIDWLKGLKENVVLGDAVPIGTGSPEIVCQLEVNKQKEFHLANKCSKNSRWVTKNSLRGHHKKRDFGPSLAICKELTGSLSCLHLEMRQKIIWRQMNLACIASRKMSHSIGII
uniref:DNA-directed RNA polymerase subunit beta'' n=1 Tax=Cryptogramma acrostichoides TaxID=414624 RepID=A0A3G5CS71_9MONI|nr:RNA polymerase beta'' subunit [Cryptogramma acrostichoides]AYW15717.1 RNA polymerase beta'' subunit [Cryptogramma acrostichoides]